jgi:deoxyadenosine/deoxycytidine kinase
MAQSAASERRTACSSRSTVNAASGSDIARARAAVSRSVVVVVGVADDACAHQRMSNGACSECQRTPRIVSFLFEGSIAAGKSTLLERIGARVHARLAQERAPRANVGTHLVVVSEPVEAWRDVTRAYGGDARDDNDAAADSGGNYNILEAFYDDPARYALAFQTHAMATRTAAVRDALGAVLADLESSASVGAAVNDDTSIIVLAERSVMTDRHIFVEMLHEDGVLSSLERELYRTAYDYFVGASYPERVGGVVYLRTTPDACLERKRARDRAEESDVAATYLRRLHEAHERVFMTSNGRCARWGNAPVLVLDVETLGNVPSDDAAADAVADRVYEFVRANM